MGQEGRVERKYTRGIYEVLWETMECPVLDKGAGRIYVCAMQVYQGYMYMYLWDSVEKSDLSYTGQWDRTDT